MQGIGRLSYSWYLWHWPVLVFGAALDGPLSPAGRLIAVAVALILAAASYRWIEQPVRTNANLAAQPRLSLGMAGAVAVALCAACLGWKQLSAAWERLPAQAQFSAMKDDFPSIYRMGCDLYYHSAEVKECAFGDPRAPHTAVLLGDSHAGHWFPAAQAVYASGDWRLVVITKSACPVVDATYFFRDIGREYTECPEWVRRSLARIREMRPDLVIVSYSYGYEFPPGTWGPALQRGIDALANTSSSVVVIRDVPRLPVDGPTCLARLAWRPALLPHTAACSAPPIPPAADVTYQLQRTAAAHHPNVAVVDMSDAVCPNGACDVLRDGVVTYRDSGHLSTGFAQRMAAPLKERIDQALAALPRRPLFLDAGNLRARP
jgi:hypothetical protein